jgi:hypothetical protein
VVSPGFHPFHGPHSARMVNDRFPAHSIYGFEMVDASIAPTFSCSPGVNRIFTPNRIIRNFGEFSADLAQCKHLRFIDG